MKKVFQSFYKKNSLATTFFSVVIILLVVNLSIKTYQYSFGEIYKGEVVDIESFEITNSRGNKLLGYRTYKTNVYPQKIKYTDNENNTWFYSESSWNEEIRYEMNEKIDVLETNDGKIYILRFFSFWFNTTNLIVIFGASIFLTIIIEIIKENNVNKFAD